MHCHRDIWVTPWSRPTEPTVELESTESKYTATSCEGCGDRLLSHRRLRLVQVIGKITVDLGRNSGPVVVQ